MCGVSRPNSPSTHAQVFFYEQQQGEENQRCDSPVVVREARVKVRTRQYR